MWLSFFVEYHMRIAHINYDYGSVGIGGAGVAASRFHRSILGKYRASEQNGGETAYNKKLFMILSGR
jgi:hypothetical protein